VFWALTALTPLAIFINNGYLMGTLFGGMAFLVPTASITIDTYQLLLTPDDIRGRVSAVMGVTIGVASVIGPALGGALLEVISGTSTVLLCAAGIGALTLLATVSPTLRRFPRHAAAQVQSPSTRT